MTRPRHAIVLGGGLAGMLAAHVLSRHLESVTVVERDRLPDGPEHRRGVPQANHAHLLWSNGARIIDGLLPGTTERMLGAGARRIGFQGDLVTLTAQGWQHRFEPTQFGILCTRPLLDWIVRDQILPAERITVRQGTEMVGFLGDATRVTGVRVRDTGSGETASVEADLVIDATGRASRLKHWLSALGVPALEEDVVDAGIGYATRLYQAPPGATAGFPAVNVAADHRVRQPGYFGVVYPVEGGRWIVTLSSTRGAELPGREDEFLAFAQQRLRHPLVADLIGGAEPLTPVFRSHSGANRRLYPERLDGWPDRLIVLGDSLTAFNPIYGHGMSSAARCAAALDEQLERSGSSHDAQKAIGAAVDDPWILAASKDIGYVNCRVNATDPRLVGSDTEQRLRFADFITGKSIRSPRVCEVVTEVMSLSASGSVLGSGRFLSLMHKEPMRPELTEPPLRPGELDLVGLSAYGPVGAEAAG